MVARPNNPVGNTRDSEGNAQGEPFAKARELRRRLDVAAKRDRGRRFHALYDRTWRGDVLREVRDRVVQMATKIVTEPIFEADFQDCSHGFRPTLRAPRRAA